MTLLKKFVGLVALAIVLFSCKKEVSIEDVKSPIVIDASWQFTESDKTFAGEIDTAYIMEGTGSNILTLLGTTEDGVTGGIVLDIIGTTIVPGTYTGDYINFLYGESSGVVYNSIPGSEGFSIVITAIDSASVTGTFSGIVKGADGTDKTIVDGKFTAPVSKEEFRTIEPDPNNDNYFALGTRWVYANEADTNDIVTITAIGDTTITIAAGTFEYKIFENDRTGEHKYYRADGNNFYEFSVAKLGSNTDPEYLDLIALKQDGAVGDLWETDPYIIYSGNLSINGKVYNSILSRDDFILKVNGFKYENLIEVDTQLYIKFASNPDYEPDGSPSFQTYYSKGIGIIGYRDFILGGRYFLRSYTP